MAGGGPSGPGVKRAGNTIVNSPFGVSQRHGQ